MNAAVFYHSGDRSQQHNDQIAAMTAIGIACEKHIAFDALSCKGFVPRWADAVFVWGNSGPEARIMNECKSMGIPCVVLELPYFRQFAHFSVSVDGLHNNGDFLRAAAHDTRRMDRLGVGIDQMRLGGRTALVIGQVPGDAQLRGADVGQSLDAYCELIRSKGYDVLYRPHPSMCPATTTLDQDMARCRFAVTFNSTCCVEFIRQGMPFVCIDKESQYSSMGTTVAALAVKPVDDRSQFLANLIWCEVSTTEIASGQLFSHVRDVIKIRS